MEEFADIAFGAKGFPQFGYGCAVFMQSDIVDFQRQGWKPEEIMAGLCNVLPKNVWLYVSQIPNISAIGTRFLLQGGTQYNLAAVKSQVDFITERFKGKDIEPESSSTSTAAKPARSARVWKPAGLWDNGRQSTFIGLDAVQEITYKTTRGEDDALLLLQEQVPAHVHRRADLEHLGRRLPSEAKTKVPLEDGAQRLIIATCEKGTVEDIADMRVIKGGLDEVKKANPNFCEIAARRYSRSRPSTRLPTRCRGSRSPGPRSAAPN